MYNQKKNVAYVINGLTPGGAEIGLELLIDKAMFDNVNLHLILISRCNSELEKRVIQKVRNVYFLSDEPIDNKKILNYFFKLNKIIKKIKPEIVISALTQSVLITRLVRIVKRFKHVTFEHNTKFQSETVFRLIKYSDYLTDTHWCDSVATQRSLILRNRKCKNKIVPLFHTTLSTITKTIFTEKDSIKIMAVGRLTQVKNFRQSLHVIKLLRKKGIDATLDIYGDGEMKGELEEISRSEGIDKAINFRGFVQDWQKIAHNYDAYLLSSNFEGLSISTLEAMSAGLPCVVRAVGELECYIIDHENGIFAETSEEAAQALMDIYYNPNLAQKLGNNAREYVSQMHSEDTFLKQINQAKAELGTHR